MIDKLETLGELAMAERQEDELPIARSQNSGATVGLEMLLGTRPAQLAPPSAAPQVGELIALMDHQPVVRCLGSGGALAARSTIDLHGRHIGAQVLLLFENGDPQRPIVIGVLREPTGWPLESQPAGQVEVDADGARLIVQAGEQLVLRCGKASITLTKAGKVLIEGSYVLSRSTGVNRIKGGSVQLN
jgi:Domain of unknown function (DUF6484)